MSFIDDLYNRIGNNEDQQREFMDNLGTHGLERFKKFYSIYRGKVMDNKDPAQRGRVLVCCSEVGHTPGVFPHVWIDPLFSCASHNRGSSMIPELGDYVRVFFYTGRTDQPLGYLGGWFAEGELPNELRYSKDKDKPNEWGYPERRGFVSRMGHAVWVSDEPGSEEINITWHKADPADPAADTSLPENRSKTADRTIGESASIAIKQDGSVELIANAHKDVSGQNSIKIDNTGKRIEIKDENGNSIVIDPDGLTVTDKAGNTITSNSQGISLNSSSVFAGTGATHPVPLGDLLLQWLTQHTHPTAVGPSGPPIVPPMPDLLSSTVKTA